MSASGAVCPGTVGPIVRVSPARAVAMPGGLTSGPDAVPAHPAAAMVALSGWSMAVPGTASHVRPHPKTRDGPVASPRPFWVLASADAFPAIASGERYDASLTSVAARKAPPLRHVPGFYPAPPSSQSRRAAPGESRTAPEGPDRSPPSSGRGDARRTHRRANPRPRRATP